MTFASGEHTSSTATTRSATATVAHRVLTWIDSFLPEAALGDSDLQRRGRLLIATTLGFALICLYFGTQMVLLDHYPLHSILILYGGGLFVLVNLPLLKWTGSTMVPGVIICVESIIVVTLQAYFDTGLYDPTLLWNLLVPWLAAFLIGPMMGFVFAGIVIGVTYWFYLLEMQGHTFPAYSGTEEGWLFYLLCTSGIALFIGFLGWLYEGQTLRHLRDTNERLRTTRDALQESNQRIVSILESITDGFFALDDSWRFTYVNRKAEELLDMPRERLLHSNALDHFEGHGADFIAAFEEAAEAQLSVHCQLFYEPLDSWLEAHIYPFRQGLTVYFNDITARKEYEQQLVQAREDAEDLARIKSELLTNMSHEIRTPLTAILGFARILSDEGEGVHQEFGEIIEQNGNRLLDTLNSVLDLAQLESGDTQGKPELLNVEEQIRQIARLFRPNAEEKGLSLHVEFEAPDASVCVDAGFLNRIMSNLVGNAIKFTEEGAITLRVFSEGDAVYLQVEDTGQGISEEFLPYVFDEFRQESTGLSRSHEGNGLGLAISRRLVEMMDGSIEVESAKGEGSSFTVVLPRHPVMEPAA